MNSVTRRIALSTLLPLLLLMSSETNCQSLLQANLYGRWQNGKGQEISIYADGRFEIKGGAPKALSFSYKISGTSTSLTLTGTFLGMTHRLVHSYSISGNTLATDPPLLGSTNWEKSETLPAPTSAVEAARSGNTSQILELKLDSQLKSRRVKVSPAYRIPKGNEQIVEDSVKVSHTVTTADQSSTERELKLSWGILQTDIRSAIQRSTGKSDSVDSELKRSIKIIGDGQAVRVVWNELYRTGIAVVKSSGGTVAVPFEYKEGFDLTLESAE